MTDHPPQPDRLPVGLALTSASRVVSRAFDAALAAEGGSLPTWLVLLAVKTQAHANQRAIAAAAGIQGATLTHHLNAMEADGLVTRRRDPDNRRVHLVELTADGEAAFLRLRDVVVAFDRRLRTGLSDAETDTLRSLLARLRSNVT